MPAFCLLDPEPGLRRRLQRLLRRPWVFIFGGCDFRETWLALEKAGFQDLEYSFITCSTGWYLDDTLIAGHASI